MNVQIRFAVLATLLMNGMTRADKPEVVSVKKIWDKGAHNAFTDLIHWRGKWYCSFREGDGHVGGDGKLRVLESADGDDWHSVGLVAEEGIDLRDPKLSVTPDDRLMMVAGGSVYKGTKTIMGRQPRVCFSKDGKTWSAPQRVLSEGEWLWRVTWHNGKAYGISYNASERQTKAAQDAAKSDKPVAPGPADWKLKLFVSTDGVKYDLVTHLDVPGHPNETTVRFLPDGTMMALVRREGGNQLGWMGTSKSPYREWKWHETKHRLGGPNFIVLPDGTMWAGSRSYPGGAKTVVGPITSEGDFQHVWTLPSGGDNSYPGMVWNDNHLWFSYYSTHEKKTSIYLAKIKLPQKPCDIESRLELFVDQHLIESMKGEASLKLHRPTPGEVVLTADKPWEGNTSAYYTVFQDGPLYRMYYRGSHFDEKSKKAAHREVTCYAESKDGLTWTKPKLGLFEFEGSKDNNIVWDGTGAHNFTPFKDANPKAKPDAKYKALASTRGGLLALKSADGIRWSLLAEKPVITKGAFDSQNLAFWDAQSGKYREYHRFFAQGVRDIMTGTSDDFLTWTDPVPLNYPNAKSEHLYTNAIQPYERAPHLLIGFPTRFLPAKQQTEPVLMTSRDGLTFLRSSEPVIPTTAPKDRDGNRSNYMAWGMVKLPGKDDEYTVYAKEAYYTGTGSRLRQFRYRVDGFMSAHAETKGGEVLTKPLTFKGGKLVLNHRTTTTGSLRVEILDMDGKVLAESNEMRGDAIAEVVAWKSEANLERWAGKPVQLRFVLKDADVFSFQFR